MRLPALSPLSRRLRLALALPPPEPIPPAVELIQRAAPTLNKSARPTRPKKCSLYYRSIFGLGGDVPGEKAYILFCFDWFIRGRQIGACALWE